MFEIRGSGGGKDGGSGQHTPVEDADSLSVKARARVLEVISEGPILGLVDGLKSVYLDNTPLENADGSFNFKDVTLVATEGTQSQGYISGFPSAEAESGVDTEVRSDTSVTRSFADPNVDAIRVNLYFPQLQSIDTTNGDTHGTSVEMAIDVQNNGGGFHELVHNTITGKASSPYEKSFRIELPQPGPWDVRVRRITPDNHSSTLSNQSRWKSYSKITDKKLSYPNSAIIAIQMNAEIFSAIPTRGYESCGVICRVPDNYTEPIYNKTTRVWSNPSYTGSWSGGFRLAWTNNPAWLLFELLTNPRWGMGEFISDDDIDKWALYNIGKYCDELVPDGRGGTEPRFRMALYLQEQEDAYKVVQNIASVFRSMAYWAGDKIFLSQDAPALSVSALYTNANVLDGTFVYSSSPLSAKHSSAVVTWNNPLNNFKTEREYVERKETKERFGLRETEFAALGCIWQGQAHRQGSWALYSEWKEGETCTWKTDLEGLMAGPGEIIHVADSNLAGLQIGGRVRKSTASAVTIYSPIDIDQTKNPKLIVMLDDGTVETRNISNPTGNHIIIQVSSPFTTAPSVDNPWIVMTDELVPQTMRLISITEIDPNTYEHIAVLHDPDKYDIVENDLELEDKPVSINDTNVVPPAPSSLSVAESLYVASNDFKISLHVSWQGSLIDKTYVVELRHELGNWVSQPEVATKRIDILDVLPGTYEIRVRAKNLLKTSAYSSTFSYVVLGKMLPPDDVAGVSIDYKPFGTTIKWAKNADLDIDGYEIRLGSVWASATFLNYGSETSYVIPNTSVGSTTYLIKAKDTSGNYSTNAVSVTTTITPTVPATLTMSVSSTKP